MRDRYLVYASTGVDQCLAGNCHVLIRSTVGYLMLFKVGEGVLSYSGVVSSDWISTELCSQRKGRLIIGRGGLQCFAGGQCLRCGAAGSWGDRLAF